MPPERQNEVYVQKEKHVVYSIDKKPFHVWISNGLELGERVLANREAKPSRRPIGWDFLANEEAKSHHELQVLVWPPRSDSAVHQAYVALQ